MSVGYGANVAETITEEQVKKVVDETTWDRFYAWAVEKYGSYAEFGQATYFNDYDVDSTENDDPYVDLVKEFEKKVKINLEIGFHCNDEKGDCHDEVSDVYWQTFNAYEKTPEAEAFEKKYGEIERKFWVSFG